MRTRLVLAAVTALVGVGLAVTLSMAAAPRQYQWTGTVTDVDLQAKTITVDKAGEVWQFSTEGLKEAGVKKGDQVTVHYVAVAKKIELR